MDLIDRPQRVVVVRHRYHNAPLWFLPAGRDRPGTPTFAGAELGSMLSRNTGVTPYDVRRVCAVTGLDDRTVRNVIDGRRVRQSTLIAVRRAALELGVSLPSQPSDPV